MLFLLGENHRANCANITETLKRRLLDVIKDHGKTVVTERLIQWVNPFRKLKRYNLNHYQLEVSSNLLENKTAVKNPSFRGMHKSTEMNHN